MSTHNNNSYQDPKNINLRGGVSGTGLLRWDPGAGNLPAGSSNWAANPFESTDYGLYINTAGQLVFSSLGSTTVLGAAGGGGASTWVSLFAANTTFQLAGTTFTIDNTTGNHRLRAGLPPGWKIGEKTGTNQLGANDIGVIWPPNRAPIVVAVYLNDSSASLETKEATIAAVGELIADIAF